MRVAVVLTALVLALSVNAGAAMPEDEAPDDAGLVMQAFGEEGSTGGDDGDDDTVNVQLVVLGIVGGVVFLLLPLGYLFRRQQGLTAYTPPADGH
jgi:hypothetical protein